MTVVRLLGLISALFVLAAVVIGFRTLGAFGYSGKELLILLAPPAIGVVLFVVAMLYFGAWTARLLARNSKDEAAGDEEEGRRSM